MKFLIRRLRRYIMGVKNLQLIFLWTVCIVLILNQYKMNFGFISGSSEEEISNSCQPISLEIDDYEDLLERTEANKHPKCHNKDWVTINKNGVVIFEHTYLRKNGIGIIGCEYRALSWGGNDFRFKRSKSYAISDGEKLNPQEEFFQISCKSRNKKTYYGLFARIFKRKDEFVREPERQPINVMFIGLDSVSREKWLANLPKSSKYLVKKMKAHILNGYNIVGDGTPAALIPILTSKHEHELPNTIKGTLNSSFVDEVYPFIWKDFKNKLNYATLYNEDWPHVGVFQYRMKGFKSIPTTHYMRPFQLAKNQKSICEYGRTSIQLNLDYIEDFARHYKKQGFFSFSHIKQYTHNEGLNDITWLDDTFLAFFKKFYEDHSLSSNTILFMFSDHGPRYSKLRKSIKGLLHERNAFFSIYVPILFKKRYPNEYASLIKNVNKVLAPMDIHATLMNLINLESGLHEPKTKEVVYKKLRGTSIFSDIAPNRGCEDAGIESYWCSCLKRTSVEVNEYMMKLANEFVDYLNKEILGDHMDVCHELELDTVNSVYLMDSYLNTTQRRMVKSEMAIKLNLLQPPKIETDYKKYLFVITTKPNAGEYEFTITVQSQVQNKSLSDKRVGQIDKSQISRINKYGNDEFCIHDEFPDIRKYCYCKK